jgi:hypothetical protein
MCPYCGATLKREQYWCPECERHLTGSGGRAEDEFDGLKYDKSLVQKSGPLPEEELKSKSKMLFVLLLAVFLVLAIGLALLVMLIKAAQEPKYVGPYGMVLFQDYSSTPLNKSAPIIESNILGHQL